MALDPLAGARTGFRLRPLSVPGHPDPLDLGEPGLSVGRDPANDLALEGDLFPSVSQHHARLWVQGGRAFVEDLGSRNGTFVNGERVERAALTPGDVVQLGSIGPRFALVSRSPLAETMFVDPKSFGLPAARAATEPAEVEKLHRRSLRQSLALALFVMLAVTAVALWSRELTQSEAENRERLSIELQETAERSGRELAGLAEALARSETGRQVEIEAVRARYDQRLRALEEEKQRIEEERRTLFVRFEALEQSGGASAEELASLRRELEETRHQLDAAKLEFELVDPVNLEEARLAKVREVRSTIVLLEVDVKLRHEATGRFLHMGSSVPNFEGIGDVFAVSSTGSGFCIAPEGWILSNAHVVDPEPTEPVRIARELDVEVVVEIHAVFSGTSQRHRAHVVRLDRESGNDIALLKIAPFEGMPYVDDLDLDVETPAPGSDVYLFGFPLGNFALQQGETVIASTFRGILSRTVGGRLQVDAGVHPGNSGGPVTDAAGRVIGLVFSVQALPDHSAVYTIGYAIPIADARAVWPPPAVPAPAGAAPAAALEPEQR